jgi:antitoxin PrlF
MITAKITSKGQITLPKKLRQKLGVEPGELVSFEEKEDRVFIKKAVRPSPFDRWAGSLNEGTKTTDELLRDLRGEE